MLLRRLPVLRHSFTIALAGSSFAQEPIDVDERLEPFVDRHLIERLDGAMHQLVRPRPAGTVMMLDRAWEGIVSGYFTVLQDADTYRMYYRGWPDPDGDGRVVAADAVTCYAESDDGITWRRPELGLFEVQGTRANNVILVEPNAVAHNFAPFIDARPGIPRDERFKALGGTHREGLYALVSGDGVRWRLLRDESVLRGGAFDSQNVAFWSTTEECYVCYYRTKEDGVRWISRAVSDDFVSWVHTGPVVFGAAPREHLYTNQTQPYFRAEHVYVATAARFFPGRRVLSTAEVAEFGLDGPPNYGGLPGSVSDVVLMTSRGGQRFDRTFTTAFVRPGADARNWVARSNYPARGIVPTGPREMSLYVQRHYGQPTHYVERLVLRTDGFAAIHADATPGEMTTRIVRFARLGADQMRRREAAMRASAMARFAAVVVDDAMCGSHALVVRGAMPITLPGTQQLGSAVTLAAHVRGVPRGHRRLFSAYNGKGTVPRELVFDFDVDGEIGGSAGGGLRFLYDDIAVTTMVGEPAGWDAGRHHLAVTWDDGVVTLWFDGEDVARGGSAGRGALALALGDLRLGEDYPPANLRNEPFLGVIDDVLVLRRCLDATEIRALALDGASAVVDRATDRGSWLAFDDDQNGVLTDRLRGDGLVEVGARPDDWGARQLVLNYETSANGSIRVEVQDADGRAIPGFELHACQPLVGDRLADPVVWSGSSEVRALAGRPVRLRFVLQDADLYSLQFR